MTYKYMVLFLHYAIAQKGAFMPARKEVDGSQVSNSRKGRQPHNLDPCDIRSDVDMD